MPAAQIASRRCWAGTPGLAHPGGRAAETALRTLSNRLLEVQEGERRHLARELHDEIGQLLTGLRLLLRMNGDLPSEAYKKRFELAREIVDDLIGRVRRLSFDLRAADLDRLGLHPALLGLFERYTAQTGAIVNFNTEEWKDAFHPKWKRLHPYRAGGSDQCRAPRWCRRSQRARVG
jgi:signal transduction histidine kinase